MTARVRDAKNTGDRVLREKRLLFFVMYKKMIGGVGAYGSSISLSRFICPNPSRTAVANCQHTISV